MRCEKGLAKLAPNLTFAFNAWTDAVIAPIRLVLAYQAHHTHDKRS